MSSPNVVSGNGEMARLISAYDWSKTSLGPMSDWPAAIHTVVAMILHSPTPIVTLWGEPGVMIYNDAYSVFAGARHPELLGSDVRDGWPEVADFNDNVVKTVFREGKTLSYQDQELILDRGDGGQTAWMNLDYSPLFDSDGTRLGAMAIVVETTAKVVTDRKLQDERMRLQQMYTQAPSFMALLEGPEHRFALANAAYRQLVDNRDVVGLTVAEAIPEAVNQGFVAVLDNVYTTGQTFRSNGTRFDVQPAPGMPSSRRYLDFIYQPITDATGAITGIFVDGIDVTERVMAQEAINASEAQFRSLAQAMPNHVWTSQPDGMLDWFNQRVEQYSGRDGQELVGNQWAQIVHPDDIEGAGRSWAAAVASHEIYESEIRIRRHDGAYRWHLVRALPIRDPSGAVVRWVGSNTDIHDQKLAEVETARDRDRLWRLSQELMLVCDFEGVITAVNPSAERMLGWTEEDMVGAKLTDFLHPDDVAGSSAEVDKLSNGAATLAFENRYRCRDGSYRVLDWTAVPDSGRIHGVGRDVTDERSIARDHERIWNISPVLKVVASLEGVVIAVNPAWTNALGWTFEDTVGRNILDFVDAESVVGARERVGILGSGTAIPSSESSLLTKAGLRRRISWTAAPECDKFYAFGRDITAEVEAAEALAASEAALRQAQKMEAVGQLTGGIAHDFNNLLQVVSGNLQLLYKDTVGNERAERRIHGALEGVARGSRLASQLLAFGRRQALAPKVVNLGRLIRSMDEMLRRALGETVHIETIVAGGLWNTLIDPGNVENALLNLAINARDAMPDGGRLTIETGNAFLDEAYCRIHADIAPGQYVMLAVSDTGTGIPPELLDKVFDPFFSTKAEGKGTGLGLSMVYGFIKQSGGHIKIYSEVGEGTTIRLYLPRSLQAEEDIVARPAGPISGGSETILVVEDDNAVRETVIELLADLGYRVLQASDAKSALAIVQSGVQIDLLFTDVVMPGPLKSAELARMAVERLPDLAVLFTSGYTENSIVHSGRLDEGVELLSKPYTREALSRRIRHQLSNAAQRRTARPSQMAAPQAEPDNRRALNILLCEDDVLIRMSTADMLSDLGHQVLEAGTAKAALELLSNNKIDLLLTDVGLPDMPGTTLAVRAREGDSSLPIIFVTGHSALEEMGLDHITGVVQKPYESRILESAIAAIFSPEA